uniref:CCHC-type domain-containing protein n=1 Tax=Varanus komodoensis TaxID=61221 RepID=A0A8D2L736_VARKO
MVNCSHSVVPEAPTEAAPHKEVLCLGPCIQKQTPQPSLGVAEQIAAPPPDSLPPHSRAKIFFLLSSSTNFLFPPLKNRSNGIKRSSRNLLESRELQTLRDENTLLRTQYAEATQRMDAMQLELDNLHTKLQTATDSKQNQDLTLRRCPLEPPPKYDGKKEGIATFKAQCELYISLCHNDFTDEKMKVGFLINQLMGAPAHWATARLIAQDSVSNNANLFIDTLGKFLGAESCKEMAIREIKRLKQGHTSATDYTTKFQLLTNDLGWNEEALMVQYREGLREEVLDDLACTSMPTTLQQLMLLTIQIDAQLNERARAKQERHAGLPQQFLPESYVAMATPQPEPEPEVYRHPTGPCFICGHNGHMAWSCPLKKQAGNFQSQCH